MQIRKPRYNPLARSALRELQASGVEITPDIVLWLHDAAERIKGEPSRPLSDIIDWPVECGGVLLYPLTFGAADWLSRLPDNIQNDPRVIAFACANSKEPEKLARVNGTLSAIYHVSKWLLSVKASMKALRASVDIALGVDRFVEVATPTRAADDDSEPFEYGAAVRALCVKYPGTTPDYWLWGVSREKFAYMLQSGFLPDEKVSERESEETAKFRAIVDHIKKGAANG